MQKEPEINHKSPRIIFVLKFLWENTDESHIANCGDILEYLQANGLPTERKTVYSDIATLKLAGFNIENLKGKNGGYYLNDRLLNVPELKILIDGVASSKFLTERKSLELISKLEKLCSKHEAKALSSNVYSIGRIKSMNESIFYNIDFINNAINQDKKITFKYFDYNTDKKKIFRSKGQRYVVSPYAMALNAEKYYLVAWDEKNGMIKHYRIDKMFGINLTTEERTKQPKDLIFPKYIDKHFSMYGGESVIVVMEFENSLCQTVIDRFGKNIPIIKCQDENHFRIKTEIAVSEQFFGWIFGLGKGAKIVSPPAVVEEMKQSLENVLEFYK